MAIGSYSTPPLTKNGLVFLTNFSTQHLAAYETAIRYHNLIVKSNNKLHLEIRETSNGCSGFGLWYKGSQICGDLSLFWDIYELTKLNRTALLDYLAKQNT